MSILICLAIALADGDTMRCQDGTRVRIAGIDAPELPGHCRRGRTCVPGDGFAARRALASVMGATIARETKVSITFDRPVILACEATGKSYDRVTAWCELPGGRDLSCAAVQAGVAVRWARYDRAGLLRECGR